MQSAHIVGSHGIPNAWRNEAAWPFAGGGECGVTGCSVQPAIVDDSADAWKLFLEPRYKLVKVQKSATRLREAGYCEISILHYARLTPLEH
jgi:hypothetical protein